ncbi:MAG TPA: metallophosphoesterase [Candidatus Dormibacteraeota bacterium]|nr:metallophosphoesterase [Candidatus Dormibacteraeota bacterium]
MVRILALADQVDDGLYGEKLKDLHPDLVVGCGDLPFDYLENIVSRVDVPLLFVPGNHDPDLLRPDATWMPLSFEPDGPGPSGCVNVDGRVVEAAGLVIAGLGGSPRYRPGPNQYSEGQMRRRAARLRLRLRIRRLAGGRPVDVFVTHTPPAGDDDDQDAVHRGFRSLARFDEVVAPRLHLHGHVLRFGPRKERRLGGTSVVNVIPYRLLQL